MVGALSLVWLPPLSIHCPPRASPLKPPAVSPSLTSILPLLSPHSRLHYLAKPLRPQPSILSFSPSKASLKQQLHFSTTKLKFLPNPPPLLSEQPLFPTNFPLNPSEHSPVSDNEPDSPTVDYLELLQFSVRYWDIELAKAVHASILKLEEDTHLSNALITAYLKLGRLDNARKVFETLSCPDVVSYTAMISGFAKSNREDEAMELFLEMSHAGIEPNEYSFVAILTACIRLLELEFGAQVHASVIKLGFLNCTFVVNALIGLYGKCSCLDLVLELFDKMPHRDIASWNTVISSLVKELMYERAFEFFRCMLQTGGLRVDHYTLSTLLAASTRCSSFSRGQELHAFALRTGYEANLSLNNALIGFYTKCGNANDVVSVFERMPVKDVVTWTEMITAYMEFGLVEMAEKIFNWMPEKNCVSYNALLAGYCQNGEALKALNLFCKIVEEGIELNDFTLTSVIKACGLLMRKRTSEQIHGFVLKLGFGSNDYTVAALFDMCTRCGRMADAEELSGKWLLNSGNALIWTSMICGYARNGQPDEAVSLFSLMWSEESTIVDEVTLASIVGVCGMLGFQVFGEQVHCHALKSGFLFDIGVGNAMISMYGKCGEMRFAAEFFGGMPRHDLVSWNSLMDSYLLHRQGDEALAMWAEMEKADLWPDSITCLLVISAYRHTSSNLVHHCRSFFVSMESAYCIKPASEHYASFVGVLGYWGLLEEGEEVIEKMPFQPEASVWRALLDGCRIRLNSDIGKRAAKQILAMQPRDASTYILQSNIYSASGRWHCAEMVREGMREKGIRKIPGRSWLIHGNNLHSFYARDRSHSQSKDIFSGLDILILECLKAGYVPDTSFVLHEVEEHQKKDFLFYHSAKLAVTYGLLVTRPGQPVRIVKNIILCGDCHNFLKYISIITKREIHVRDASGFHYFLQGQCSCKEYWS